MQTWNGDRVCTSASRLPWHGGTRGRGRRRSVPYIPLLEDSLGVRHCPPEAIQGLHKFRGGFQEQEWRRAHYSSWRKEEHGSRWMYYGDPSAKSLCKRRPSFQESCQYPTRRFFSPPTCLTSVGNQEMFISLNIDCWHHFSLLRRLVIDYK